jgi:hypothetical protein
LLMHQFGGRVMTLEGPGDVRLRCAGRAGDYQSVSWVEKRRSRPV